IDGVDSVRVKGIAYDPETEAAVFPRDRWDLIGAWPATVQEVALGGGLATLLDASPGMTVLIESRTSSGAINAMSYRVSGIVHAHSPVVDAFGVWMPMNTAQALVQAAEARSHIAVRLRSRDDSPDIAAMLSQGGWRGQTVIDEVAEMLAWNAFRRRAVSAVVLILMAIAATGIANTVIMSTYERIREIGTLRAMGMRPSDVRAMFLIESGLMGLFAGLLGALVGAVVVRHLAEAGIDLTDVVTQLGEVSMSTILYARFSWAAVGGAVLFGATTAVLASLYPAHHAARMNPADAVRAE
ncbi:MAG: FtsX-like permease family protein, partial [Myxococcota bacterium]